MYVRRSSIDIMEMLPIVFGILIGFAVLAVVVLMLLKNKDKNKQLITRKVTILEKPVQQGTVAWYVMQCENGERIKLRSFEANRLLIAVGDKGIVSYRGQTIESFRRE